MPVLKRISLKPDFNPFTAVWVELLRLSYWCYSKNQTQPSGAQNCDPRANCGLRFIINPPAVRY